MKKIGKKLQLHRETISALSADALARVAGGVVSGADSGCKTGCVDTWPNATAGNGCTFFCPHHLPM